MVGDPEHSPPDTARGQPARSPLHRAALRFVVIVGVLSLFADLTYESARALNGPYLAVLGASATAVGVISGGGELLGYLVRFVSGFLANRTHRYWLWTTLGYLVNLVAAPALALAGNWPLAAGLIIAERIGKGFRNPPRDAMLSHAGSVIGQGWAFALREALDQTGALVGPLLVAGILFVKPGDFPLAYGWLVIPALLALLALGLARWQFPRPQELEQHSPTTHHAPTTSALPSGFWRYLAAMALTAVGYADFNLLAYHLHHVGTPTAVIPVFYTLAMGTAGLSALVVGRWFDRHGLPALIGATLLATTATPLVFLGNLALAALGVAVWGIGLGIQDSLMSAPLSVLIRPEQRAHAFGVFNAGYGIAWWAGSSLLGLIYDHSLLGIIALSVAAQLAGAITLLTTRNIRPLPPKAPA